MKLKTVEIDSDQLDKTNTTVWKLSHIRDRENSFFELDSQNLHVMVVVVDNIKHKNVVLKWK